ncbi:hypothetical protein AWC38_SpisGene19907 [Stylophora pistillata]|uniref:STPR domain-containing protein n=1 Tax=Stylophora pistillata TaxID=50429 RepID=A0A2B4RBX8_STYPI|nr:hypothetical protein AWC38_SpisGene19907 [Stylophora pistillata]
MTEQHHELIKARAEAFQLREELTLLRNEVAQSRLPVDRTKNSFKFNSSKKNFWECDKASRSQKRKKIRELMLNAVEKLPTEFTPVEIKFNVYGQELTIPLANTTCNMEHSSDDAYTTEVVRRILAAKDQGLVSDRAYHELRMALPEDIRHLIPPLSALIQERRDQNKTINTIPIPQAKNGDGSRRSIREVLEYLLGIEDVREAIKRGGRTVRLRFAADGRRTSKRIGTVMAVFNILAEERHSFEYQYTLALYNGKEDYEELKECLGKTFKEIETVKSEGLEIDGEHFDVEWGKLGIAVFSLLFVLFIMEIMLTAALVRGTTLASLQPPPEYEYNVYIPSLLRLANYVEENQGPAIFNTVDSSRTVSADFSQGNELFGKNAALLNTPPCLNSVQKKEKANKLVSLSERESSNESVECGENKLAKKQEHRKEKAANESAELRENRQAKKREYQKDKIANESAECREKRLAKKQEYQKDKIANEYAE